MYVCMYLNAIHFTLVFIQYMLAQKKHSSRCRTVGQPDGWVKQPEKHCMFPSKRNNRNSTTLYATILYSTLLCSSLLYSTLLYSTLLYSTLSYSYSTLLHYSLLYSTLLYSTILYYATDLSLPSLRLASTGMHWTGLFESRSQCQERPDVKAPRTPQALSGSIFGLPQQTSMFNA